MKKVLFLIGKGKAGNKIIEKFSEFEIFIFSRDTLNLNNLQKTKEQIINFIKTNKVYPDLVIFNSKNSVKNTIEINNLDLINLQESLNIGANSLVAIIQALEECNNKIKKVKILVSGGNFAYSPNITQFNLSLTKILLLNIVKMLNQFNNNFFEIKILEINGKIGDKNEEISPSKIAEEFYQLYIKV